MYNDDNGSTRSKRIFNSLADSTESSVLDAGKEIISVFVDDAKSRIMDTYKNWKNKHFQKPKFEDLDKYIKKSNETIQIGMEKKEISIMWAMKKLGYTEKETQEILDLANKAYLPSGDK